MLSRLEMDVVESAVNSYKQSQLPEMKKHWLEVGTTSSIILGFNKNKEAEQQMFVAVEHLLYIDQRLEKKGGWWFRTKRRLHYVNHFRKNYIVR